MDRTLSDRIVIKGEPIVAGFAIGRVFYYQDVITRELELLSINENQVEGEVQRLKNALNKAHLDLANLKSQVTSDIDAKHAEIFSVHQLILKDIDLIKEIEKEIENKLLNVEQVVQNVFQRQEQKLRGAKNNIFQERANDVVDVGRRLLKALMGVNKSNLSTLPDNAVIFAQRLLPSDTALLNVKNAKAIVTVEGAQNSHAAILARALDIPFVAKINIPNGHLLSEKQIIVDGEQGEVIINPTPAELKSYPQLITERLNTKKKIFQEIKDVTLKKDDELIRVYANVSSQSEFKMARMFKADGIGLYRTEPFYMGRSDLPNEDELFAKLTKTLNDVSAQNVFLRLLDISGDKTLPFLNFIDLKDPSLGLNGIRFLLKYPRLLELQLRVFLRLSAKFNINVVVPMVTLASDMKAVCQYLSQEKEKLTKDDLPFNSKIPVGAMIETPAALMSIDELLEYCDFLSFGTNDLVQYVMAAGREKIDVADYYEAGNQLILPALKIAIQKAKERGKECCLCGELAGNLKFTEDLLNIGIRNFSVQPALIPSVKNKIHNLLKK
jgi:phosphotransferase system enzyme I (PtsI)